MLSTKKCMTSYKDNEITKQKRLLVQVVGSTESISHLQIQNILTQAKVSLKNFI